MPSLADGHSFFFLSPSFFFLSPSFLDFFLAISLPPLDCCCLSAPTPDGWSYLPVFVFVFVVVIFVVVGPVQFYGVCLDDL